MAYTQFLYNEETGKLDLLVVDELDVTIYEDVKITGWDFGGIPEEPIGVTATIHFDKLKSVLNLDKNLPDDKIFVKKTKV